MSRRLLLVVCLLLFPPGSAFAIEEIEVEEGISDLLPQRLRAPEEIDSAATRQWAILPQLGYAPDTGPLFGAKFTHRNLFGSGVSFDVDGTYSLNEQQGLSFSLGHPFLADGKFLLAFGFKYRFDPQRDFFGLGNNDEGPDPASTNSFQDVSGTLTAGWRPIPRLAVNLSLRLRDVHIGLGDQLSHCGPNVPCPFTPVAFPGLPGVQGGTVSPFAISLVYNGRDEVVRPTRGWRAIAKVIHTNKALISDFEFTRFVVDLGYLRAFFERRLIAGIRLDGEWIVGPNSQIPYWELAELGGDDTMRGFFPHRFVGKGRALANSELKFLIAEFDFFDVWHVKFDGVVFGDGGRVFLNSSDARDEFKVNAQIFERIVEDFRYSYGAGLRFALGEALSARVDVGFSDEETALVYLAFGQTF